MKPTKHTSQIRQINNGDSLAPNTGRDWTQSSMYCCRRLKSNLGNTVSGIHADPARHIKGNLIGADDFYLKYAEIKAFDKAQPRHYRSILEYLITRGSIYEDEQDFLFRRDDLMTIKKTSGTGNQNSRFHDFIVSCLARRPESILNVSVDLTPVLIPHTLSPAH